MAFFSYGCAMFFSDMALALNWVKISGHFYESFFVGVLPLALSFGVLLTIWLDSRRRKLSQRLFHYICIVYLWHLAVTFGNPIFWQFV
jgi:hypothetical protein